MLEVLGKEKQEFFFDKFLEYFFTEDDAKFFASLGLNCIRVPFNYRHFEDDLNPRVLKESGFTHLDRVVELAGFYATNRYRATFARFGVTRDLVFNGEFQILVGGPKWLDANNPRLACFRKYFGVRGLGFFDSGYTTFVSADSNTERNYLPDAESWRNSKLAPFKNSVGVGTRLYMQQIVLPLLGVDFGYGLEARDFQVYLAIGLTD